MFITIDGQRKKTFFIFEAEGFPLRMMSTPTQKQEIGFIL